MVHTRLARSDVLKDLGDERPVGDGGDDAHLGTAPRTLSQVNGEDPSQPLHPGHRRARARCRLGRGVAFVHVVGNVTLTPIPLLPRGAIAQAVQGGWGANPPTQTVIGVACLATPEILFEVEALAARS